MTLCKYTISLCAVGYFSMFLLNLYPCKNRQPMKHRVWSDTHITYWKRIFSSILSSKVWRLKEINRDIAKMFVHSCADFWYSVDRLRQTPRGRYTKSSVLFFMWYRKLNLIYFPTMKNLYWLLFLSGFICNAQLRPLKQADTLWIKSMSYHHP